MRADSAKDPSSDSGQRTSSSRVTGRIATLISKFEPISRVGSRLPMVSSSARVQHHLDQVQQQLHEKTVEINDLKASAATIPVLFEENRKLTGQVAELTGLLQAATGSKSMPSSTNKEIKNLRSRVEELETLLAARNSEADMLREIISNQDTTAADSSSLQEELERCRKQAAESAAEVVRWKSQHAHLEEQNRDLCTVIEEMEAHGVRFSNQKISDHKVSASASKASPAVAPPASGSNVQALEEEVRMLSRENAEMAKENDELFKEKVGLEDMHKKELALLKASTAPSRASPSMPSGAVDSYRGHVRTQRSGSKDLLNISDDDDSPLNSARTGDGSGSPQSRGSKMTDEEKSLKRQRSMTTLAKTERKLMQKIQAVQTEKLKQEQEREKDLMGGSLWVRDMQETVELPSKDRTPEAVENLLVTNLLDDESTSPTRTNNTVDETSSPTNGDSQSEDLDTGAYTKEFIQTAFKAVGRDDVVALRSILSDIPPISWLKWRNGAGDSLVKMADARKRATTLHELRKRMGTETVDERQLIVGDHVWVFRNLGDPQPEQATILRIEEDGIVKVQYWSSRLKDGLEQISRCRLMERRDWAT